MQNYLISVSSVLTRNKINEEEEKEFLTHEKELLIKEKHEHSKDKSKDSSIYKTFDKSDGRTLTNSKTSATDLKYGIPKVTSIPKLKKVASKKKKVGSSHSNKPKTKTKTKATK